MTVSEAVVYHEYRAEWSKPILEVRNFSGAQLETCFQSVLFSPVVGIDQSVVYHDTEVDGVGPHEITAHRVYEDGAGPLQRIQDCPFRVVSSVRS